MRLIATDYDGTLNHGGIDEAKLDAIRRWRAAGHKFGIISGRGPDFLARLQEELGDNFDFLVSCNGGIATDRLGHELFSAACDTVDTRSFVADMLGWGARMIYINYEDKCVRVAVPDFDEEYEYTTDTMPPIPSFYKMATFFPGPDEAEVFAAKVKETYGDRVNPLQNWWCVDIAPAGVNKAEGIRRLCALYGVAEQDVIAVGDNLNDGDMLKAFYSYAMEHGHPDAKGMATRTTANVTDMILRELGGTV
ncbi:MAG: HAD family phosphatase [Clostridia bacterium]|nr:HAD family phosphatase [Clostridia bacterium]